MDASFSLAQNVVKTRYEDIPDEAVKAAKKQVLDCLGVALAGSSAQGVKELLELAQEWGGSQQSSIIAHGIKLPAPHAAQVNATMMHALDYDDGHGAGLVHPGVISVSTSLAAVLDGNSRTFREISPTSQTSQSGRPSQASRTPLVAVRLNSRM